MPIRSRLLLASQSPEQVFALCIRPSAGASVRILKIGFFLTSSSLPLTITTEIRRLICGLNARRKIPTLTVSRQNAVWPYAVKENGFDVFIDAHFILIFPLCPLAR